MTVFLSMFSSVLFATFATYQFFQSGEPMQAALAVMFALLAICSPLFAIYARMLK